MNNDTLSEAFAVDLCLSFDVDIERFLETEDYYCILNYMNHGCGEQPSNIIIWESKDGVTVQR